MAKQAIAILMLSTLSKIQFKIVVLLSGWQSRAAQMPKWALEI
jgi:hypothetical protein